MVGHAPLTRNPADLMMKIVLSGESRLPCETGTSCIMWSWR